MKILGTKNEFKAWLKRTKAESRQGSCEFCLVAAYLTEQYGSPVRVTSETAEVGGVVYPMPKWAKKVVDRFDAIENPDGSTWLRPRHYRKPILALLG